MNSKLLLLGIMKDHKAWYWVEKETLQTVLLLHFLFVGHIAQTLHEDTVAALATNTTTTLLALAA